MRIDLHAHSNASDGTLSPAGLVWAAAEAGLDVVAITDHDTTAGWAPAAEAARAAGAAGFPVTVVPGAELSCRWYQAEPSIPLHLLAYLFDPLEPDLVAALTRVRASRSRRTQRMVDLLVADGIDVTVAEIEADAAGATIGRPHVARALVRRGLVPDVGAAFAPRWLGERYRVPKEDLDVFEALRLIRGAGGVAVFAHPRATRRGRIVPDSLIEQLAAEGLFGLEADHPDHTSGERAHVRGLAADLGMVVTGSSDFHGANKTVKLAECTTAPAVYHRILDAAVGAPWAP